MKNIGRNDPCPCGSGKKYKKCCLQKDQDLELKKNFRAENNGHIWKNTDEDSLKTNYESMIRHQDMLDDLSDEEYDEYMAEFEDDELYEDDFYDDLTEEQVEIIDNWWDRFYLLKNADEIKEHINTFLISHPDMVPYLELSEEPLSTLGQKYLEVNQFEKYINFIRELNKLYPQETIAAGGYVELDILTWLLAKNRIKEIPEFLDPFQEYPLDYVSELSHAMDLFLLMNKAEFIVPVLEHTYQIICENEDIIEPYSMLHPIIANFIDKNYGQISAKDIVHFLNNNISVELNDEVLNENFWKEYLTSVHRPFDKWPELLPEDEMKAVEQYRKICENYMQFLKERVKVNFATAEYLAIKVDSYFLEILDSNPSSNKLFNLTYRQMHKNIEQAAGGIWLNFVKLMSILNGFYYFTDYLQECGNLTREEAVNIKTNLEKIHKKYQEELDGNEYEQLLFKDFPIIY